MFTTLGQSPHENRQSYMYHKQKINLRANPQIMTWIDGFPLSDGSFSIDYNSIFGISFQVVQVHLGIVKFY